MEVGGGYWSRGVGSAPIPSNIPTSLRDRRGVLLSNSIGRINDSGLIGGGGAGGAMGSETSSTRTGSFVLFEGGRGDGGGGSYSAEGASKRNDRMSVGLSGRGAQTSECDSSLNTDSVRSMFRFLRIDAVVLYSKRSRSSDVASVML